MTTYPAISLHQPWATLCATPAGESMPYRPIERQHFRATWRLCDNFQPHKEHLLSYGTPVYCPGLVLPPMVKRYETRSHPCPPKHIGQRIAIHAARKLWRPPCDEWDYEDNCTFYNLGEHVQVVFRDAPGGAPHIYIDGDRHDLPLGAVVATAIITASLPMIEWRDADNDVGCEVNYGGGWLYPPANPPLEWIRAHPQRIKIEADCLEHQGLDGVQDLRRDISDQLPYGDWTPGHWAWQLDNVEPLTTPVPWRGRQGWFTVELTA